MSYEGPNLGLETGFEENQDGWGPPYNEAMRRLDALTDRVALDVVDTLPGSPMDGDRYLLSASASASENANKFAVRVQGAWSYYAPPLIQTIFVKSLGYWVRWHAGAWVDQGVPNHGHSIGAITGLTAALAAKQNALGFTPENSANKGNPNGYASLDGSGKVPSSQLPAAGGGSRPVAPTIDADHELVYTFAQSSGDFLNAGDQGAGQNIATIGTCLVRRGEQGPFGDCARVQQTGTPLTGNTYNPPGGSFSVEIWFSPSGFPANPMYLANKSRLTSGHSGAASDTAIGLYLTSGRNLGLFIWAGGAMRSIETTDSPVLQGVWQHLAGTFDGANLRLYWNGVEVAAGAYSGSVDYGAPGRWHFATFPGLNSFGVSGILGYALVSSVARNSAYMKAAFRNGMPGVSAAP